MKKSLVRLRRAGPNSFTLIELLVVIAIIAILVAVLLPVASLALNSAKRTKAKNTAVQIQAACLGYYTEYSVYPVPAGTTGDYVLTDLVGSQSAWGTLICILCGNVQPASPSTPFTTSGATITNSHGIAFLSLSASDVDSNNAPKNPLPTGLEIYYNLAINSSYSGVLGTNSPSNVMPNFAAGTTAAGGTSTAGVAVWANCNGKTSYSNVNWWVYTY
jgi:prepilin-type N-terminal cleavage/methylation domain-containing protein